jgi:transcriptional regulator with XRE-family HTH domain
MTIVRELRQRAGLTQSLLAKLSGVSVRTISEYESGRGSPTMQVLSRLATAAGMDVLVMLIPGSQKELYPFVLERRPPDS